MEPADGALEPCGALPPGVAGPARGRLRLDIDAVRLDARPGHSLQVRLKWWGQEAHGPALVPGKAAVYGVACPQRALARYLADAPLEASVWDGGRAVGACALSMAGLAEEGFAEAEASIVAPGSSRRLGTLSAHASLRFTPGPLETRAPAAGSLFEPMLPAAERAAAAALAGEEVDGALALDRWRGEQLGPQEQAYALTMLGGAPPGAQATPAQLLAALEGCAAAEQAARDWLAGAGAAREPGVAGLAAALLERTRQGAWDGGEAVSVAAVAGEAAACAPHASLQQLRLLLAALWQDSGGRPTREGVRELCALLAAADAGSSGTEAGSSAPESPRALPAGAYPQAGAARWAHAAPAEQLSLSLQPQPAQQLQWQQAGSLWGAASQQAWPLPWGPESASGGAFASVWPHVPLAPVGFPAEPQQPQPRLELIVGVPADLPGPPWARPHASRRLSGAAEGPGAAADARRRELAALIERAEALHSDMGRALRAHGQLRAAAGAARGKLALPGSRPGSQRGSLDAGEAGGKENAAAEGPPGRPGAGRTDPSSAERPRPGALSDPSSRSPAASPRAPTARSGSLASAASLAEGPRLAGQLCSPDAEPAGPPVGCEGGPDVLHALSLRLSALQLPAAAGGQRGLPRPSHCWLVHRFPGEPGALRTLPLPWAERQGLRAAVQHELVLPGGSCLGGPRAPGSLRFELWQSVGAAAAPFAAGELPLAAVARLELPLSSRAAAAAACAAHACSLPLRPLCRTAGGWDAAEPPALHLQLEYAVQALHSETAAGPAACGALGEAQPCGPVKLRARVLRACGLQAAVEEAAAWLAGGGGGGGGGGGLLAQAQRQGPRAFARLAWPGGCSCLEAGEAAEPAPAAPSACPQLTHCAACSLAPGDAAAVCRQELCVELWHLASHREAAAAQLAAGGSSSSGSGASGREVFLGRARLPLASLAHSQGCEEWLPLRSRRGRLAGGVLVRLSADGDGSDPRAAGLLPAPEAGQGPPPASGAGAAVSLTVHECLLPPEQARAAAAGAACHLIGRLPGLLGCFRLEGRAASGGGGSRGGCSVSFGGPQTLLVAQSALPALLEQPSQLALLQPAGGQAKGPRRQQGAPAMRAVAWASVLLGPADRPGGGAVREAPLFCPASSRLGSIRFSVQIEEAPEPSGDAASWQPRWRPCPPAREPASPQPEAAEALQDGEASLAAEEPQPGSSSPALAGSSAAPAAEQRAGGGRRSADGSQEQQALRPPAAQAAEQPQAELAGPRLRIESALRLRLPAPAAGAALAVEAAAAGGWACRTPAVAPAAGSQAGSASAVWGHAASLPAGPVPRLLTLKVLAVAEGQPRGGGAGALLGTAQVGLGALQALREVCGWYELAAPGGGSAGQLKVCVTAADAPQGPAVGRPVPAAPPAGSASELRGALRSNLQELDGLLARLGAAPQRAAHASASGTGVPQEPRSPAAAQPEASEAAAPAAQQAASDSLSSAAERPAAPASPPASAGGQLWEGDGSGASSAAAGWPAWEPPELESLRLSQLLRGLDGGDGSGFLDPDFDLALPGASPAGSADARLLAAEAEAAGSAADAAEGAAAEEAQTPRLPGRLGTCSDDEGGAVDLGCLAAASGSGSSGSSSPAAARAAAHNSAWSLGAGALMLGGGADDWLFNITRSRRASDAAAQFPQPRTPPEPAAEPGGGAAADAGWPLVASLGGLEAGAAQRPARERGAGPALVPRAWRGDSLEAETADTSSLGVETLTTSSEAPPEGPEERASLSSSGAGSEAAGPAAADADALGWDDPPQPPPDAREPPHAFLSELGPPPARGASPREHPLLCFDPFSQAPPSPPGRGFGRCEGSMRSFAPAEFAAELECPPSPGRSSADSRRSGALGRQPLRSPRWRGGARSQVSGPLLPELGSLSSLHSLPEAGEEAAPQPPAGRGAQLRPQDSTASAPIVAVLDPRLQLATPYDASLASSEEAWDNPLLSPLHLVPESLRSSGSGPPAARDRLPPRPRSAPPRTPAGAAARAPDVARQSPREGPSAAAAGPAHSRSQPALAAAAAAPEAAAAGTGALPHSPASDAACGQAPAAEVRAAEPPAPGCSAASPEPQQAPVGAAAGSEAGSSPEPGERQPASEEREGPPAAPEAELPPAKRLSEACTQTEPPTPAAGGAASAQPQAAAAERAAGMQPQGAPQQAAASCTAAPLDASAGEQPRGWPFDQGEPGSRRPVRHESGAPSFHDWQAPPAAPAPGAAWHACERPPRTAPQPAAASSSHPAPGGNPIGTLAPLAEAAAASRRPHTAAAAAPPHSSALLPQRAQPMELLGREGGALGHRARALEPAAQPRRPAPRRQAFEREAARMAGLLHDEE